MPIYEYLCRSCGEEFEVIHKVDDPPPSHHSCSPKSKVERKLSLSAFQLKGGGWYAQGYSKGKGNGNGSKAAESKPSGADGGSDKGSAKPAAKADTTPTTPAS